MTPSQLSQERQLRSRCQRPSRGEIGRIRLDFVSEAAYGGTAVDASKPRSPVATQHSLPSGRYSLLGPDFHRLDHTSFSWRTYWITSSAIASPTFAVVQLRMPQLFGLTH
jgi:hypothetical protein